jgi:AraC-like DNA-binding protein
MAVYEAVSSLQVDAGALALEAGLDHDALFLPGARIPEHVVLHFWELAVTATRDPCLGLRVASHVRPTSLHGLSFAWLASPTLGDVLARTVRYQRLWLTSEIIDMRTSGRATEVILRASPDYPVGSACRADAFFATLLRWVRYLADDSVNAERVYLRHDDHGQFAQYRKEFRAPVLFNAESDRISFGMDALARVLPGANELLAAESDRIIEAYLNGLEADHLAGKVRGMLVDLLPQGQASQDAVAQRLHMSKRTLQRKLAAEGRTFVSLVDETRKSLAIEYMREERYPLIDIAYRLGFSDPSALSRAFKRWTGLSPTRFRQLGG